jgi:chromosome segregation ATPase
MKIPDKNSIIVIGLIGLTLLLVTTPVLAQADADGDQIPNGEDRCPQEAGRKEGDGCPLAGESQTETNQEGKAQLENQQISSFLPQLSLGFQIANVKNCKSGELLTNVELSTRFYTSERPQEVQNLQDIHKVVVDAEGYAPTSLTSFSMVELDLGLISTQFIVPTEMVCLKLQGEGEDCEEKLARLKKKLKKAKKAVDKAQKKVNNLKQQVGAAKKKFQTWKNTVDYLLNSEVVDEIEAEIGTEAVSQKLIKPNLNNLQQARNNLGQKQQALKNAQNKLKKAKKKLKKAKQAYEKSLKECKDQKEGEDKNGKGGYEDGKRDGNNGEKQDGEKKDDDKKKGDNCEEVRDKLDEAKQELKEAREELRRARARAKDSYENWKSKLREWRESKELIDIWKKIFKVLNKINSIIDESLGVDADPTNAFKYAQKALKGIEKIAELAADSGQTTVASGLTFHIKQARKRFRQAVKNLRAAASRVKSEQDKVEELKNELEKMEC